MNNSLIGKWLNFLGIFLFAIGLSFIIIEELSPYKIASIILMFVGVALNLISVVYRKRSRA